MKTSSSSGKMMLPSATAVALWHCELSGQLSDGMWEGSGPREHWKFWCHLEVTVGAVYTETNNTVYCRKNAYSFASLYEIVGDRMLANARMAKAGADPMDRELVEAGEHMPATIEEFRYMKAGQKWPHDYVGRRMERVTDELAVSFYATTYTMKDMKADIKLIKSTMKLFNAW